MLLLAAVLRSTGAGNEPFLGHRVTKYIYIHILEFGKIHAQHMANIRGNGNCM